MISIVIPTLNEEHYMEPLLKSLAPQLHKGDEIIIVDSHSKDKTLVIAHRYGCRVIQVPKTGIAAAKNAGARTAKNGVVAFLDADSVVGRHWLEKIRNHFYHNRSQAIAGLDLYHTRNPKNEKVQSRYSNTILNRWKREKIYNSYSRSVFQTARLFYMMGGKPWLPANNCAVDRKVFLKIGGYANVICEDAELMRRWPRSAVVHYDPKMIVRLSDRRFRKVGFRKTLAMWLIADFKALYGNGTNAKNYGRV